MDYLLSTGLVLLLAVIGWIYLGNRTATRQNFKEVPQVSGGLPLLGHFLKLKSNPTQFLDTCLKKCGDIFTIRIGLKKMVVIANRELGKAMIVAPDSNFSKQKLLYDEGMIDAVLKQGSLAALLPFMRHAMIGRISGYTENCFANFVHHIERLKAEVKGQPQIENLNNLVTRLFTVPVLHTILGEEPSFELQNSYAKLIKVARKCQLISHFVPQFIVRLICKLRIQPLHDKVISHLVEVVLPYVKDPSKMDSLIMRMAVDLVWSKLGNRVMTPMEAAESLLIAFFAFDSNNPYHTLHVIKELSKRPDICSRLRNELDTTDLELILKNPTLEAVIFEAARLNAAELSIRKASFPTSTLGEYDLGNCDCVSIYGGSIGPVVNSKRNEFYPERYFEDPETSSSASFWFWGGGVHACPGRGIAINLTKVFTAKVIKEFDLEFHLMEKNSYVDFDATREEKVWIKLTPLRAE